MSEDKARVFNRCQEKEKRRVLRQENVPAERLLWARLSDRQVGGHKFRRQYSVGPYILDFYCPTRRLAVELDGESHASAEAQADDAVRTEFLNALNIQVGRFINRDVYSRIDAVVEALLVLTGANDETSPQPSPSEGEGVRKERQEPQT